MKAKASRKAKANTKAKAPRATSARPVRPARPARAVVRELVPELFERNGPAPLIVELLSMPTSKSKDVAHEIDDAIFLGAGALANAEERAVHRNICPHCRRGMIAKSVRVVHVAVPGYGAELALPLPANAVTAPVRVLCGPTIDLLALARDSSPGELDFTNPTAIAVGLSALANFTGIDRELALAGVEAAIAKIVDVFPGVARACVGCVGNVRRSRDKARLLR